MLFGSAAALAAIPSAAASPLASWGITNIGAVIAVVAALVVVIWIGPKRILMWAAALAAVFVFAAVIYANRGSIWSSISEGAAGYAPANFQQGQP